MGAASALPMSSAQKAAAKANCTACMGMAGG